MARIEIKRKHVMVARDAARRESTARITGKSVFIKRCYGKYRLIGVVVSKEQRKCRDIFSDAQKLASYELKQWNKKRHWARLAKTHKVKGAHRMAVSAFYKLLKENGMQLDEALMMSRKKRYENREKSGLISKIDFTDWNKKKNEESPFYYRKFDNLGQYYDEAMRLAG